jgi:hypothetical protein
VQARNGDWVGGVDDQGAIKVGVDAFLGSLDPDSFVCGCKHRGISIQAMRFVLAPSMAHFAFSLAEATSIDEVAQEQKAVDLRNGPALVDRSQATKVGGEVAGFCGRQSLGSKVAVGSECCRPAFGPVP